MDEDFIEVADEISDHAEEMLIVASEDDFIAQYDPMFEYARGDDGWLHAIRYDDHGQVLARYRVGIVVREQVPNG